MSDVKKDSIHKLYLGENNGGFIEANITKLVSDLKDARDIDAANLCKLCLEVAPILEVITERYENTNGALYNSCRASVKIEYKAQEIARKHLLNYGEICREYNDGLTEEDSDYKEPDAEYILGKLDEQLTRLSGKILGK